MELTPGYKQTPVGAIPESWDQGELGESTVKIGSGITPTGGARVYRQFGRPFVRSQNVGWGSLLLDDVAFIDDETHASFNGTEIQVGDVLLNITGASIGRSAVADGRLRGGNVNQHVCIIRPQKQKLDSSFLNCFLLSTEGQRQIDSFQAGGNRQGLNFEQIRAFRLPLPPFPEQCAISATLREVDALISALNELIGKKRSLTRAARQELLTGKKRLPEFAGGWTLRQFETLFQFLQTANNPRAAFSEVGDVAYIHYGDIHTTASAFLDCSATELPRIARALVAKIPLVEDGDLVMVDASEDFEGLGKSVEIRNVRGRQIVGGLHTFVLRGDRALVADGFKAYLQFLPSVRTATVRLATGISVYGLSKNNVRSIEVLLPNVHEQAAIAAVLSDMDAEIAALEARRDKTSALKQGMMQELLAGRTRLV